jgi:L-glyceraldehyde 3-phosphate reductase
VPYTLLNPTAGIVRPPGFSNPNDYGNVIGRAHGRCAGTAIFSPLAGGTLTDQNLANLEPHPLARTRPTNAEKVADRERGLKLKSLIGGHESLAASAYRFILANPAVTSVIGGFSDAVQLVELTAVSDGVTLPPEVLDRLHELWRSNFGDTSTAARSA